MRTLLQPLVKAGNKGVEITCRDGYVCHVFPILAALLPTILNSASLHAVRRIFVHGALYLPGIEESKNIHHYELSHL
jgi:hypothetical protein